MVKLNGIKSIFLSVAVLAGCNKLPWAPSFEVISISKAGEIPILHDSEPKLAVAKAGHTFLLVKMRPLKAGSTEDLRLIGGGKDGYPALGVRWNPMSGLSLSGIPDPPFQSGQMKIEQGADGNSLEMFVIDVAFELPISDLGNIRKMRTRADGGTTRVSLPGTD